VKETARALRPWEQEADVLRDGLMEALHRR